MRTPLHRVAFCLLTLATLVLTLFISRRREAHVGRSDPGEAALRGRTPSIQSVPGHAPSPSSNPALAAASLKVRPLPQPGGRAHSPPIPSEILGSDAFIAWIGTRDPDPRSWSPADVAEGVTRAKARRAQLKDLIPKNPRAALAAAVPTETRRRMPAGVLAELEESIAGRGLMEVLCPYPGEHPEGHEPPHPGVFRTFHLRERTFQAFVYGRRQRQLTTRGAVLHGIAIDELFAVAEAPTRLLEPGEVVDALAAGRFAGDLRCVLTGTALDRANLVVAEHGDRLLPLASVELLADLNRSLATTEPGFLRITDPPAFQQWSHGTKRLLFMRARFPDDLREPISEAEAAEVMRQANDFFVSASFNNLSVISTIGPLVTLPQPKLYYAVRGPGRLIEDAREATRTAGLDSGVFDLDMVRFESVPGFNWGGLGSVGGKGVWLQGSGLGVVTHELGHNLGLSHANFWNTVRPEPPEDTLNLPLDADSLVGLDDPLGPGDDIEYGDPFDVMGGGGGPEAHYTALHKTLLGWIPAPGVLEVRASGVYRIEAHDGGRLESGSTYVLRVRKDNERDYWVSARSRFTDNPWLVQGVELHWNNWQQAIGSSELLDTTPGSRPGKEDAALGLGRTFTDAAAGVSITPLRKGIAGAGAPAPYYDVYVSIDESRPNAAPQLELEAGTLTVQPGQPVSFVATASDPDGDPLAYSWVFGEGLPGPSQSLVTNSWSAPGDYVVRCEVSDLRGGVASRHVTVRVGQVALLTISGRVIDQSGLPLAGVRVHNGQYATNGPYAEDYRWAYTDSDGSYTLAGLSPGSYSVGAFLGGYTTRPLNFSRPLILNEFTGVDVSFIATALPEVSVARARDGSEASRDAVVFQVTRAGPTNDSLRVYFQTAGSATPDDDYAPWPDIEVQTNTIETVLSPVSQVINFGYVDLPPGVTATNLAFPVNTDAAAEENESLIVKLAYPVSRTIISETETNYFDIPGWETLSENGVETWFQTRPLYQLGRRDEAVASILDNSPTGPATISIMALDSEVSENEGDSAGILITRVGLVPSGDLHIPMTVSGTSTPGEDFESPPAEVFLPAGSDAVRISLFVREDRFLEGNESVILTLEAGDGYRLGNRSATVTLVDNDLPLVTVSATDPVLAETDAAVGGRVTFQRSGDLSAPLDVDYLASGSATAGADYQPLPGRVTLPAGASTATIVVVPRDDGILEGDETIVIQLGDSPVYNAASPGRATVLLRDDEFPSVTVEAIVAETTEGGDPGVFLIRRTGSLSQLLTVHYHLGGSAIHQADYVASGDRIEIPQGRATASITVTPIDDAYREDPETIAIELLPNPAATGEPAYTLGTPARAAIDLMDNGDGDLAVGFALLSSSGTESRTNPDLAVRISGNPEEGDENAVTVDWIVLGGTARNGSDYVLTNGSLVFPWADPEGDEPFSNRVAFIPLEVINDQLVEPDETIVVRLRIAPTVLPAEDPETPPTLVTNGVLDVLSVHTYTILDDDLSEVSVVASVPSTVEGSSLPGRFTIQRTGATNAPLTVAYSLSGLAAVGSDYLAIPSQVTIPAGRRSEDVLVSPMDDPIAEYRENVVLTLVGAPSARVGNPAQAELFIEDNDGTLEFSAARWEVNEGEAFARIVVRRTGPAQLFASARFRSVPGTAREAFMTNGVVAGDYWPTNGVVTFAPGEVTREFEVPLIQDDEVEGPETIELQLSRASDLFPLGGQNVATLTILDDDALLSTGTNITAGIESDAAIEVTLERSGRVDAPVRFTFIASDNTAIAGQDFVATEGSLEFGVGQRTAVVRIPLLDDVIIEGDETLLLHFYNESGALVGEIPAVIVDDDCAVTFTVAAAQVDEDAGVVELTVVRQGSPLQPVQVDFSMASGTAEAGSDFSSTGGTISFKGNRFETLTNGTGEVVFVPGETNAFVTIPIVNDAGGERDETFTVALSHVRAGSPPVPRPLAMLGTYTNVTVTILDNETPGRVDDGFQPGLGADASVRALAVQQDGKILVGGDFATLDGVVLPRLGRLHADGILDQSFNPGRGLDGSVLAIAQIEDGRILVAGAFTHVDDVEQPFLSRLEPDGTRSTDFSLSLDGPVRSIVARPAIYLGGDFTRVTGIPAAGVVRLTAQGILDPGFSTGAAGRPGVSALAIQEGGKVLAGGEFQTWGGNGRFLTRLLPDGTRDPGFNTALAPNGPVTSLAALEDGSVLAAGNFTSMGGVPRAGLARILASGAVDGNFDPGSGGNAAVLALGNQHAGRIIAAGIFDQFAGQPAGRFVRLEPDGTLDEGFFRGAGANDVIRAIAVQSDGAFVIGGDFTTVNGRPRLRVARIHSDEEFAEGFVEFTESVIHALETQPEAVVRVRRSGTPKAEARVRYLVSEGTATAGVDFEPVSGELVFAPGVAEQEFTIPILNDVLAEGSESVRLTLTNAMGAVPGRQADATLVIEDDESAIAFDLATIEVGEEAGHALVVVRRSGPTVTAAQVSFATEAITAASDIDFEFTHGTLVFPSGTTTQAIRVELIDDALVEGPETLLIRLASPSTGIALGSQSVATLTLHDDDQLPTTYTLTIDPGPGGAVVPGGGRFATNSLVSLLALPDPGFEFARWEGTVASADNPLVLLMDQNHVVSARFLPRTYLESFESGDFSRLPWSSTGNTAWTVTNETAATGRFAARSGVISDRGASVLGLDHTTGAGGGAFDFRTSSERGWDFLEFSIDGARVGRWSGVEGWQTFTFHVPAGNHHFEWRFSRDPTFGDAGDAAWIDNLDLPSVSSPVERPRLHLVPGATGWWIQIEGTPGIDHILETTTNLRTWSTLSNGLPAGASIPLIPSGASPDDAHFYRVRVE